MCELKSEASFNVELALSRGFLMYDFLDWKVQYRLGDCIHE